LNFLRVSESHVREEFFEFSQWSLQNSLIGWIYHKHSAFVTGNCSGALYKFWDLHLKLIFGRFLHYPNVFWLTLDIFLNLLLPARIDGVRRQSIFMHSFRSIVKERSVDKLIDLISFILNLQLTSLCFNYPSINICNTICYSV
jgi:hypothetical protein